MNPGRDLWVVSDTHFNHEKMNEIRPAGCESKLRNSILKIPEDDVLIHLGDVALGDEHFEHLHLGSCRRILVIGNHDNKSFTWYLNHGWSMVCEKLQIKYMGFRLIFTHIPLPRVPAGTLNLHGHTHTGEHRNNPLTAAHLNVCPESIGYEAVRLRTLLRMETWRRIPSSTSG